MTTPIPTPEEQLLAILKEPVKKLLDEDVDSDVEPEKHQQFLKARKADLYYQGKQNVAYQLVDGYVEAMPVGSPLHQDATQLDEEGFYDYVMNIVKGDGRKFAAVLGNRAPNVKGVANNEADESSVEAARKADAISRLLYAWWRIKQLHRYVAFLLWKAGTVFAYTPYVASKYKYGSTKVPQFASQPQTLSPAGFNCPECGAFSPGDAVVATGSCPKCSAPLDHNSFQEAQVAEVPVQVGEQEFDNGRVECHLFSVLQVTIPFYSRNLEDVPWLRLEYEEHKGRLMAAYPNLRDQLDREDTSSDHGLGYQVRQTSSSPTGTLYHRKNLLTYKRYWLRPEMFELVKDEQVRAQLYANYPDGLKATVVGKHILKLENERIDWVWSVCKPETSDFVYADPLSWDHVQIQDIVNVLLNIGVETLERAIPWMMADPALVDFEQLRARQRRPAEVVPTHSGAGVQLKDAIHEAPVAELSEQMVPFQEGVHEKAREIAGVTRAIFGGETGAEITAREYEGKRNQAMMQFTTTWDEIREFIAATLKNGVRQLVKFGPSEVETPSGSNSIEAIQLSNLEEDNWHYEVEETIPITPGQRADRLMFLLEKGPTAIQLLSLMHPKNASMVQDLLGMTGLYVEGSEEMQAVSDKIKELLQAQPIQDIQPGPIDPMTGAPLGPPTPILRPSIEPGWAENSALWVAAIKAWAITKIGRQMEKSNPAGWSNVIAYGEAHEQRLQEQQAAMAPPPGGPAPVSTAPHQPMPPVPAQPSI